MPAINAGENPKDTTDDAFIILEGVTYRYPKGVQQETLDQIDLMVHPGQYLLISGASGSGKSTLVRTFNGLIPHFYGGRLTGRVSISGQSVQTHSVAECFHQVGLVAQNPQAQLFNRTVTQELAFGLESLGLPRNRMDARIKAVTADLGIETLLKRRPQTLSGGEQQLVAVAAVLVAQPKIVVLDEPLANLDPAHVRRLRQMLARMLENGMGIVVCEHRMGPTLPDAHGLVVLQNGRVLIQGPTQEALSDPRWVKSSVELPLAVQMGKEMDQKPLPLDMNDLSPKSVQAWVRTHGKITPEPAQHGTPTVLKAENIGWALKGRDILKEIHLTLCAGQCIAVVGANGAGKTTLLKTINGLIRPTSGRIWINGNETTGKPAWQVSRDVGTAFQNPDSQFFKLTVGQELSVGPKALGCYDAEWIEALIQMFRLEHLVDRAPFKLSGGEKKRVAFAAALASKPAILVLDEPTAGQDGQFSCALIKGLEELRAQGTAILIVTHALNFAEAVASHWVVMSRGRIVSCGAPHEIMADRMLLEQCGLEPTERFALWQQTHSNG